MVVFYINGDRARLAVRSVFAGSSREFSDVTDGEEKRLTASSGTALCLQLLALAMLRKVFVAKATRSRSGVCVRVCMQACHGVTTAAEVSLVLYDLKHAVKKL